MSESRTIEAYLKGSVGRIAPSCWTPLEAALIEFSGFDAVHISGNAMHKGNALPDAGLITMGELVNQVAAIFESTQLPLIVDADTGFGNARNVTRAIRALERAGASAIHIEDQVTPRRLREVGQSANVISTGEMVDKLKAALDARRNPKTAIIARCEDRSSEDALRERLIAYGQTGVDALWTADFGENIIGPVRQATGGKPFVGVPPGRKVSPLAEQLGVKIMCFPTVMALGGMWGAHRVLMSIKSGTTADEAYKLCEGIAPLRQWYRDLGEDHFPK